MAFRDPLNRTASELRLCGFECTSFADVDTVLDEPRKSLDDPKTSWPARTSTMLILQESLRDHFDGSDYEHRRRCSSDSSRDYEHRRRCSSDSSRDYEHRRRCSSDSSRTDSCGGDVVGDWGAPLGIRDYTVSDPFLLSDALESPREEVDAKAAAALDQLSPKVKTPTRTLSRFWRVVGGRVEHCRVCGIVSLKGSHVDSQATVCHAVRLALQSALQPLSSHGDVIVAVHLDASLKGCGGLLRLDPDKSTDFRFDVRIPHIDSREAMLDSVRKEAQIAGANWFLPALVESLGGAGRVAARLSIETDPPRCLFQRSVIVPKKLP
eukprot:TRINITY_DN10556_c0_g1_i1.p1 TRINITY_DN10556_c0_g1~~TRINITY_DN10556_c0_g1_i1.p1  ORF type:complete len:341 (-),score=40.08 TRINITY_DN10556_c0_g1_i1:325-1293(-)